MSQRAIMILVAAVVAVAIQAPAWSGASAGTLDETKLAFHIQPHLQKGTCTTSAPTTFGCDYNNLTSILVTEAPIRDAYDVYLVVLDINPLAGLGGASFGLDYNGLAGAGVDVFGWTLCADLEFPGNGWPAAGGGDVITFSTSTNCQNNPDPTDPQGDAVAVLGALYVYPYSMDQMEFTYRNYIPAPDLAVADCLAAQSDVSILRTGIAGFGIYGFDPCGFIIDPVEPSTWGGIKKLN